VRLVLRADAGVRIGIGHVMRSLALGQAWQEAGGDVSFLSHQLPDGLKKRLGREGFTVEALDEPPGSAADAERTRDRARALNARAVVVDGYQFDASYHATLKGAGLRLGVIDDYGHAGRYLADVVVNQNLGVAPTSYPEVTTHTQLLLGTRYAMLRREFRRAATPLSRHPERVLVTLGGSDPDNVTLRLVEALASRGRALRALVGGANPHGEVLRAAASRLGCELRPSTDEMADELSWADAVVCGGGTTAWELCCLGRPSALVVLADNQRVVAAGVAAAGAGIDLGWYRDLDDDDVRSAVGQLLDPKRHQTMSTAGRALVDGQGASRVVAALLERADD
jgi:UDP-2,4-diacetamido-2,4,6-trideoxy-beta-L-altropyranose hydrolase